MIFYFTFVLDSVEHRPYTLSRSKQDMGCNLPHTCWDLYQAPILVFKLGWKFPRIARCSFHKILFINTHTEIKAQPAPLYFLFIAPVSVLSLWVAAGSCFCFSDCLLQFLWRFSLPRRPAAPYSSMCL